jgi:hypothetical protein
MDPEIEREIHEIKKKVEENQKLLRKIHSSNKRAAIWGFIKWIIYLGVLVGVYSILKPYIDQIIDTYTAIQQSAGVLSDMKTGVDGFDINSIMKAFNNTQ